MGRDGSSAPTPLTGGSAGSDESADTLAQVTTAQRRTLTVLGGVVVLVALVLALTSTGGDGGAERLAVEGRTGGSASTTTSSTVLVGGTGEDDATATTVPLVPLTTGVPIPEPDEAPPVTAPPSATPVAGPSGGSAGATGATPSPAGADAGGTVVTAEGATITRSPSGAVRTVDKAKGCNSAAAPGWNLQNCGALKTSGTVLLWLVESKGKTTRALVLKEQTDKKWAVVLSAADVDGTAFSKIGVRGEDVSGDGQPELVFGFRRKDAAGTLSMDVVDATPAVVAHRNLAKGVVQVDKGVITTWAAASGGGDYDQVEIRYRSGAWRAGPARRVARSAVPASMI